MKLRALDPLVRQVDTSTTPLPRKQALPFYLSHEWRSLITSIKRTRGNQCDDPDHPPDTPRRGGGGGAGRIYGDHIVELKDGGAPLDPRNIMLRCHACHARKTMRERTLRYHGGMKVLASRWGTATSARDRG